MNKEVLAKIAADLVADGKGILAADESLPSIEKRFNSIGVVSSAESRRAYRELLFTTPGIEKFISGIIMFDETARQKSSDGVSFPQLITRKGIMPGIKVDKGLKDMPNFPAEKVAEGLDGLEDRLEEYLKMGMKFAKFRTLIVIGKNIPSDTCVFSNADIQARFAATCQSFGVVPVVEPEVFMEGDHSLDRSAEVLRKTLKEVFAALYRHKVYMKGMLLKSSWAHPALGSGEKANSQDVAKATLEVFKDVLPDDLPGVVFLSGGDSPEDSSQHLDALNKMSHGYWRFSFSFGRALQEPVLKAWSGKKENIEYAQKVFYERCRLNSLASMGQY